MKLKLGLIIVAGLILGGCQMVPPKSGVEIMSYPTAAVIIDGKEAGMTPYRNNSLKPGRIELKLKSDKGEWTKTLELKNNISTVVYWEFGDEEEEENGYVLYMEKTGDMERSGLMVQSTPSKGTVSIDGEIKGMSPMKINDIGEGDKKVTITYPGRKNSNVFVKAIKGYQLVIETKLGKEKATTEPKNEEIVQPTSIGGGSTTVTIKQTETGWLRVRDAAGSSGKEVAKVKPGEEYQFVDEEAGWYLINLGGGNSGWVSASYADKSE